MLRHYALREMRHYALREKVLGLRDPCRGARRIQAPTHRFQLIRFKIGTWLLKRDDRFRDVSKLELVQRVTVIFACVIAIDDFYLLTNAIVLKV